MSITVNIYELEKEEIQDSKPILKKYGIDLEIIKPYKNLILPLTMIPRYVHPRSWANTLSSFMEPSLGLAEGSRRILKVALMAVQQDYGVIDRADHYQYCGWLGDVCKKVEHLKIKPHTGSKSSLLGRLQECIETLGEETLGRNLTSYSPPQSEFRCYVLHDFDPPYKVLAINYNFNISIEIRSVLKGMGYKPDLELDIIEEAKPLLINKEEKKSLHRYFLDRMEAARGLDIGLVFLTQIGNIQEEILNACSLKMMGKMDDKQVIRLANSLCMRKKEAIRWASEKLEKRFFITHTKEGTYHNPSVIKTAEINLPKAKKQLPPFTSVNVNNKKITISQVPKIDNNTPLDASQEKKPSLLSDIEQSYLNLIGSIWPALPLTEYDHFVKTGDRPGIGRSAGDRTRKRFLENNLMELVEIKAGGKIKHFYIPLLTEKGKALLSVNVFPQSISSSIGAGIAHTYKCHLIGFILRQQDYLVDYDRLFTVADTKKYFVDVSAIKPNHHSIAIEIEESLKNQIQSTVLHDIQKCTDIGFDQVYVVLPTTLLCKQAKKNLSDVLKKHPKVQIVTLSHFIEPYPDLWDSIVEHCQKKISKRTLEKKEE